MLETVFKNQIWMTFIIGSIWVVPGIIFTSATNRKYKQRQKEKQIRKISKLYPQ
tara:strand:- start:436 stop:597 length:162 start_codon:yes stop_codon:yes gene_type:complete